MPITFSQRDRMLDIIRFAKDHPSHAFNKRELARTAKKGRAYFMFPKWISAWNRLVALGIIKNVTNEKGKVMKTSFCLAVAAQDVIDEKMRNISPSGMDVRGSRSEPEDKPEIKAIDLGEAVEKSLELDKENEDRKLNIHVEVYNAQRQEVINEIAHVGIRIKKLELKGKELYKLLADLTA